jgi:hypothetical protein
MDGGRTRFPRGESFPTIHIGSLEMRFNACREVSRPLGVILALCCALAASSCTPSRTLTYKTTSVSVKKNASGGFYIANSDKLIKLNKGNHDLVEWSLDSGVGAVDSASVIFSGETPFASPYFDITYAPAYSGRVVVAPNTAKTYTYEIRVYVGGSATPSLADPGIIIE